MNFLSIIYFFVHTTASISSKYVSVTASQKVSTRIIGCGCFFKPPHPILLSTRIPKSKHPHPSIYCKMHGFSVIICHLCWKWYFNYALDKYAYFDTTFIMLVFIIGEKLTILWNWRMRFLQDAVSRDAVSCGCG